MKNASCAMRPFVLFFVAVLGSSAHAAVWFVDLGSPVADGDAMSWGQAAVDIPAALDAAEAAGDANPEVWVASGLYEFGAAIGIDLTTRPFNSFTLRGGFSGTENSPAERPEPASIPPDNINDGTRFFGGSGPFLSTDIPVVVERINVSDYGGEGTGRFISSTGGTVEVREVYCLANEGALLGGDIRADGSPTVLIEDSRFEDSLLTSSSGGNGGSIWVGGGTTLTVRRSIFDGCEARSGSLAPGDGGAISMGGGSPNELNVEDCTFLRCNAFGQGGAIAFSSVTTVTIQGSRFVANDGLGDAISGMGSGPDTAFPVTISDSEFVQHSGVRTIFFNNSNVTMSDCVIAGNTTVPTSSASVVDLFDSNVTIEGTTFSGNRNRSTSGKGGAVHLHASGSANVGTAQFNGCTFINNQAVNSAGAILAEEVNVAIDGSTFEGNHTDGIGGAIYLTAEMTMAGDEVPAAVITGSTFRANSAGTDGGAIVSERDLEIRRSKFQQNRSEAGGAIQLAGPVGFEFENSVFAENIAIAGAVLAAEELRNSSVDFCTFYGNRNSNETGAAIEAPAGLASLTLTNNIFANTIGLVTGFTNDVTVSASNNLVTPGVVIGDGSGQMEGDADFLDPPRGDFRLASGDNVEGQAMGDVSVDIRGAARPQGSGRDIGAYEFTPNEDRDGDRVPDIMESTDDSDGDGTPDYLDGDNNDFEFTDINADGQINAVDIQLVINAVLGV